MNTKTFSFDVGDFKCVSISDGIQPIDGDFLPNFFAGASADELAEAFRRHGISLDYYDLHCNCLLIDTGTDRVLIDSGGGPFFDPHLGNLVPGLASVGYKPSDINTIVLTHGHRDHVCGGVDRDDAMIFPNARHVMVRGEWEYWANLSDEAIMGMEHAADIHFARHCLGALISQLDLIEAGDEVATGVRTVATPGHTRNHISVEVVSRDETLLCVADTMDVPIHIEITNCHPSWDELPETGIATRRKLLRMAVERSALIHGFHFPFPGVGKVHANGYVWRFEPYQHM